MSMIFLHGTDIQPTSSSIGLTASDAHIQCLGQHIGHPKEKTMVTITAKFECQVGRDAEKQTIGPSALRQL